MNTSSPSNGWGALISKVFKFTKLSFLFGFKNFFKFASLIFILYLLKPSIEVAKMTGNYVYPLINAVFKVVVAEVHITELVNMLPQAMTRWEIIKIFAIILGAISVWYWLFKAVRWGIEKWLSQYSGEFPMWIVVASIVFILEVAVIGFAIGLGEEGFSVEKQDIQIKDGDVNIVPFKMQPMAYQGFTSLIFDADNIFDAINRLFGVEEQIIVPTNNATSLEGQPA